MPPNRPTGLTRRRFIAGAGVGLSASTAWWLAPLARHGPLPNGRIEVVGHRGAEGLAPPNTIRAIRAALEYDVDGIEIDVQRTNDGTLMLFHDPVLDWDSSGHGWIRNTDWEEIEGKRIGGEPIITLSDALAELAEADVDIYLEMKADDCTAPSLAAADRYGVLDRVTVISFDPAHLEPAKDAGVPTGLLGTAPTGGLVDDAVRHDADLVLSHYAPRLGEGFIRDAREAGLTAGYWKLLETKGTLHDALETGPDLIVTNFPDYAVETLGR